MRLTSLVSALVAVSVGLLADSSSAQTRNFAIDRFEPSERGSEWFAADSLDLRGKARPMVGVVGDYGHRPYGRSSAPVVDHQMIVHVGASFVFVDRLRLGLNMPFALSQDGSVVRTGGGFSNGPTRGGQGDLRLGLDARLVGAYGDPFTLAIGARVWLPTGDQNQMLSDGAVRAGPHLTFAGDAGISYSATVGAIYRPVGFYGGKPIGSELPFAVAIGKRFLDNKLLIGPELLGRTVLRNTFAMNATTFELLFGGHYTAGDFRIGLGGGPGLTNGGVGSPAFRFVGSLEWVPAIAEEKAAPPTAPSDRDGDTIVDSKDACPDDAGPATGDPATDGCPDRDKDSIIDKRDACPDKAGPKNDDPTKNGCPLPSDGDGDGIVDAEDACPTIAGVKTDDPKTNGCPSDKDKDGVADNVDACPDIPGIKTDDPKTNGCPGDKDKDSIRDDQDACPDDPGPKHEDPKKNGCPQVFIAAGQVKILEQIKFKTGSAIILPESQGIIDAVAKVLKDHQEIKKVRVEGHTDNKGPAAMNKTLSKQRAASVVTALIKAGVDKGRLTSTGLGMDNPIDSNETDAGRANNRRVEFHIEP